MKRFEKPFRDNDKRRPPHKARERDFGGRDDHRGGRPQGGFRGYEARGGDFEGGRPPRRDDRRDFDAPRGGGDRRNTFRRPGGPSAGYGRPFSRPDARGPRDDRRDDRRDERPAFGAPRAVASEPRALVPLQRLKNGVAEANRALAEVVEQFGHTLEGGYDISALEVTVSFGDDGRFLGFGKGGAASMTLSITPVDGEALLHGEEDADIDLDESMEGPSANDADFDDDDDDATIMQGDDAQQGEGEAAAGGDEAPSRERRASAGKRAPASSAAPQPTFDA